MKIYTKTGDDGDTGLFGGGRVQKDDPRVEAYGDVDELKAALELSLAQQNGGQSVYGRGRRPNNSAKAEPLR
ncbi:MAG TPA: hypothetical protein VNJ04_00185 [Gemmatimonadaceae bacterium]|nr:hypothetical protein [Gemmatimonadaceae bacterium]